MSRAEDMPSPTYEHVSFQTRPGGVVGAGAGSSGAGSYQGQMPAGYSFYNPYAAHGHGREVAVGRVGIAGSGMSAGGGGVHGLNGTTSFPASNHHNRSLTFQEFVPRSSYTQSNPTVILPATQYTLHLSNLEPWMDTEYVKQVANLMSWEPSSIKVPHPAPDSTTGQVANNPGYCFLTFGTHSEAASVLAQITTPSGQPVTMPNSSKPFVMNWASSVPPTPLNASFGAATPPGSQQFSKEYSIFVGDLAPETSNSDLVSVFRNPVLGLRNDREPKIICPFASCKSAKIMLDPVTGVSRGYGFVRFTDETDQQRALIEMHGLYCLSRPMRISPATAKFKPHAPMSGEGQFPSTADFSPAPPSQAVTIAVPLPVQGKSVSTPIASSVSNSSIPSLSSSSSVSTLASSPSDDMMNLPHAMLAQIAQQYSNGNANPPPQIYDGQMQQQGYEEPWKSQSPNRAALGNLIGPNGEQLTSTDPYNTTVFVGGLSPLISEQTLTTFFAPFGDIHYVKVPVGKHCGFVQFVRKADAERAIEKMQGFPVGGSRIRLSWGRSQYKAAQAAAQAQQATELAQQQQQAAQAPTPTAMPSVTAPVAQAQAAEPAPNPLPQLTQDQLLQLLQQLGYSGVIEQTKTNLATEPPQPETAYRGELPTEEKVRLAVLNSRDSATPLPYDSYNNTNAFGQHPSSIPLDSLPPAPSRVDSQPRQNRSQTLSMTTFSPFSPDQSNLFANEKRRDSAPLLRTDLLPHPSKSFAPGFGPDIPGSGKVSPTASNGLSSSTGQRYASYLDGSLSSYLSRTPAPISRPSSGQREFEHPYQWQQQQQQQPQIQREYSSGPPPREYASSQPRDYAPSYAPPQQQREYASREYLQSQQRDYPDYAQGRDHNLPHEQDLIQDLNGTLASLDLDHRNNSALQWKTLVSSSPETNGARMNSARSP